MNNNRLSTNPNNQRELIIPQTEIDAVFSLSAGALTQRVGRAPPPMKFEMGPAISLVLINLFPSFSRYWLFTLTVPLQLMLVFLNVLLI
jgi:hypothetical protein